MSTSVQVIIPNYNHASYLAERLKSIALQTYGTFQAVVLDDFSADTSRDIIDAFVITDPRFSKYYNTVNSGSTFVQWNKGVAMARSEYIWIAESDDSADPLLLQTLIAKLGADPEIVLAYCQSNRMNAEGEVTGSWLDFTADLDPEGLFTTDFIMDGKEYIQRFLIHRNTIPNASAVLFRKSVFEKVGGALVNLKTNGDWLTWLKMLCFGKVAFVAASYNYFRYHNKSVIAKAHQTEHKNTYREQYDTVMRREFVSFLKQHAIGLSPKLLQTNQYYISLDLGHKGLYELKSGQFFMGWKHVLIASFYPKMQSGFIKKALGLL
ncbi:glycosyltransferase involved in cell wall biosynthesis [Algoriphagus boseongensis]|uniref:Glycosyltransferase involved in cell wall biosynthesis n=1 Tax=Algoriphagus boseongensis TaxID=1442587 RepID=A0A4R6T9D3_9BACT|nr:glycosyltransferase family 2 protein [Algoriphagus boseongensis]TDQ19376.1 glycosyltransferase involved in cell wall biosynthesis [Algoriphagus boseongensis]